MQIQAWKCIRPSWFSITPEMVALGFLALQDSVFKPPKGTKLSISVAQVLYEFIFIVGCFPQPCSRPGPRDVAHSHSLHAAHRTTPTAKENFLLKEKCKAMKRGRAGPSNIPTVRIGKGKSEACSKDFAIGTLLYVTSKMVLEPWPVPPDPRSFPCAGRQGHSGGKATMRLHNRYLH